MNPAISVELPDLQALLKIVCAAVPTTTAAHELKHVYLAFGDDRVRATGTDLDTTVRHSVLATVEAPGAICAPAERLREIARELPPGAVRLELEGDRLIVSSGSTLYRLNTIPAASFPKVPSVEYLDAPTLPAGILQTMISKTSFAVSTDETRPNLMGALLEPLADELRMVATNGHRLALCRVSIPVALPRPVTIPRRGLSAIADAFPAEAVLSLHIEGTLLGARAGDTEVLTRLIDLPFPNYTGVIPTDHDKALVADTRELASTVRRIATVASDVTHRLDLSLSGANNTIQAVTTLVAEGSEPLLGIFEGDPAEIALNATYLGEMLRLVDEPEVRLTMSQHDKPALLEGLAPEAPGDEPRPVTTYLLMPLVVAKAA